MPSGFVSSPEKDLVRERFDLPLIRRLRKVKRRRLAYFGLPGEDALDLEAWKGVLRSAVAVEKNPEYCKKMREKLSSQVPEVRSVVHLGEVDKVILSNVGEERSPPVGNAWDSSIREFVWHFDVIYLDYFGPFLPDRSTKTRTVARRRTRAMRRLFESDRLDKWGSWILLLTVDTKMKPSTRSILQEELEGAKPGLKDEINEAIDFMLSDLSGSPEGNARLIRGSSDLMVSSSASSAGLQARPRGSVLYRGSGKSDMIHLAYEFQPARNITGKTFNLLFPPLLKSPILRPAPNGSPWLELLPDQCPGMSRHEVEDCLGFLGRERAAEISSGLR